MVAIILAAIALLGATLPRRVVRMSVDEWRAAKADIDKKGWYEFKDDNVRLVITNGLPNAEFWLPVGVGPGGGGGYGNAVELHKPHPEPLPYQGQTTH